MPYALLAHPAAQAELDALPARTADGLRRVLRALAEDPRSPRFDLKPLKAVGTRPPPLRLRVGDYRVLLSIDHRRKEVRVARIGRRSDVYRSVHSIGD